MQIQKIGLFTKSAHYGSFISGMVFTKTPKCTSIQEKCDAMVNTTVLFYNTRNAFNYSQWYYLFKLHSNGEFQDWSGYNEPYNWTYRGHEYNIFGISDIMGAAFIPKTMELFLPTRTYVFKIHFKSTSSFDIDNQFIKFGPEITGGFEFNGKPFFIINNTVYEYYPNNKQIKKQVLSGHYFIIHKTNDFLNYRALVGNSFVVNIRLRPLQLQ